jgi:hypothetical protein
MGQDNLVLLFFQNKMLTNVSLPDNQRGSFYFFLDVSMIANKLLRFISFFFQIDLINFYEMHYFSLDSFGAIKLFLCVWRKENRIHFPNSKDWIQKLKTILFFFTRYYCSPRERAKS